MPQEKLHIRCPACGKVSQPQAFSTEHELTALTQHFIGGKGHGFSWERRELLPRERAALVQALRETANRLSYDLAIDVLSDPDLDDDAFARLSEAFLQAGQDEQSAREQLIGEIQTRRLNET